MLSIRPISIKDAQAFVKQYHRHNIPPVGGKFAIACCNDTKRICGVAICGRPVARSYDNGITLESIETVRMEREMLAASYMEPV